MKDMIIRKFQLDDLNPAKYNPRKKLKPGDKEFQKLENSIKNFGYVELIVVNVANNNTVISGHQRLSVLKHLGETEVECVVVELGENEEKALNVAMNKVAGQWDEQMLADLLKDLDKAQFNTDMTGFDRAEIEDLFSNIFDKKVKEDDFDVEKELKQPVFSKAGDLWHLGRHRVFCGDSTKAESYEALMDGERANMILSDLPYFVDYHGTAGTIKNDALPDQEAYQFTLDAMNCMAKNLADDGSIYIFHADTKGLIFRKAFDEAGFYLSGCCIWKKNALVLGRSPYQFIHEPILYGWKKTGKHQWYSDRKQTTVWQYDKPRSSPLHPTTKPVPLMAYPIKNSTMTNGIVLDPFLGSGSTLIACEETERVCRGIELDPKFVDVIVRRFQTWCQEQGQEQEIYVIRDGQKLKFDEVTAVGEEAES